MPEYTLRNLDPRLWSRFTERANYDGWQLSDYRLKAVDSSRD